MKMAAAVVESCEVKCADVLRDVENATLDRTGEPSAATPRRHAGLYQFRAVDLLCYASSVTFLFADVVTDSIVCVEYLLQGHLAWGCFAMGFTVLPACVTQLFSLRWHRSDGSLRTVHWLLHFLLLGFVHRYLTLLYTAMRSLKNKSGFGKDESWVYRQESDICMLFLFKSFMGAAPQLILQVYIRTISVHMRPWATASAATSLCSLIFGVLTYLKAMENINDREHNHTTLTTVTITCLLGFWHGCTLISRIIALSLAAIFLRAWFLLFLSLHWLFMTTWVILQKTDFCPTVWEERIYNCIVGLIYCFDFFNVHNGSSRYRVIVFYSVIVTQNLIFLILYILRYEDTLATSMISAVTISSMIFGLTCMLVYYSMYHPSKMATSISRNISEHSAITKAGTPFKLFHRGSLVSLHSIDISPRIEEVPTDKQSLLTNIVQISDCVEEGVVNRNYSSGQESNAIAVRLTTECERPHSRVGVKHKEEVIASANDNLDSAFATNAPLSSLYPGLPDIDSSQKRRGIYEHDITPQLDWHAPDILSIDLDQLNNLDNLEQRNSLTLDSCSKVISALDVIKNREKLTTPTPLESSRIFDIEKVSKDLQQQQRDETMSCVTSIHDYENVCPLGIARPPWCIRSWKGYTDIETYIHDDSVVRDRRRDTLTSTTGTTYSSEYSDGMISRGILKQDDYADALTYDLVESKGNKSSYSDSTFSTSAVDDQNTNLYMAKPVVFDDRGGMFALDTILEERDDVSSEEKFQHGTKPSRNSASTLVSTIDQIRQYTAENSPRHIYHTTGTQWEDLTPNNLMARARFAKMLFDNDLRRNASTTTTTGSIDLTARDVEKREIDAIREFVRCSAIESIKTTPLIEAILSDSPILGSRARKLERQETFADRKNDFDANESDLYIEMSPLVSENGENLCQARPEDIETAEAENFVKRNSLSSISKKSPNKKNLSPILSNNNRRINNMYDNRDDNDRHSRTIERDERNDKSLCNMHFNLKNKRQLVMEQVL